MPLLRKIKNSDRIHLIEEMESLPVDPSGIDIMVPKGEFLLLKVYGISSPAANIIKQQMLSIGGECAVSRGVSSCLVKQAPVILMGTLRHFGRLIDSLQYQCFGLTELRLEIENFIKHQQLPRSLDLGSQVFDFSRKTYLMGVLNVTPDSFSDGGKYPDAHSAVEAALKMVDEGADIIDIGGESTRPGADAVDLKTELHRVLPVIQGIRRISEIPLSIDTYKSEVAEAALGEGVNLVNEISGLTFDLRMAGVIAKNNSAVALMHIKGTPKNMQQDPLYKDLIDEILMFLAIAVNHALEAGIQRNKILIDPGIGFGKKWQDNYYILRYLNEFTSLNYPVLLGPSRKSFIGKLTDTQPEERLPGTLAAAACAVLNGANMLRVHDVPEVFQALRIADAIVGKSL